MGMTKVKEKKLMKPLFRSIYCSVDVVHIRSIGAPIVCATFNSLGRDVQMYRYWIGSYETRLLHKSY